jgi:hypothetical protein
VIVPLVEKRESDTSIRTWVTACSRGEEAAGVHAKELAIAARDGRASRRPLADAQGTLDGRGRLGRAGPRASPPPSATRATAYLASSQFSIAERIDPLGGKMAVDSAPRRGTRVALAAPLDLGRGRTAEPDEPGAHAGKRTAR